MVWNTFVKEFSEGRQSGERINLGLSFASFGQAKEDESYMPICRSYGFIYDSPTSKYVAHELAHGAFALHHTFDEADYLAPEGTTDNLMDYATATDRTFNHWQWQDIHQPKNVRFKWAQDEEGAEWTTDGHYYLFTYLGLLMGLDYETAEQYGKLAEEPDSKVTNAGDMEENITWLVGNLQQRNHALTGGEHGVELAATAYAITNCLTDKNEKYLFHRFGDCYAHYNYNVVDILFGMDNVELNSYINAFGKYITNTFVFKEKNEKIKMSDNKVITIQPNKIIYDNEKYITSIPRGKFIQMVLRKILTADSEGGLESPEKQKKFQFRYTSYSGLSSYYQKYVYGDFEYTYSDIVSDLKKYLPEARQNSYEMFGADQEGLIDSKCPFTIGHGLYNPIGLSPDPILRRRSTFSLYVRHTYQLLCKVCKKEYAIDTENIILRKIDSILNWVDENESTSTRFDGIFAFEIICAKEKIAPKNAHGKKVSIPIKYLDTEKYSDIGTRVNSLEDSAETFHKNAKSYAETLKRYLKDTYELESSIIDQGINSKTIIVEIK